MSPKVLLVMRGNLGYWQYPLLLSEKHRPIDFCFKAPVFRRYFFPREISRDLSETQNSDKKDATLEFIISTHGL